MRKAFICAILPIFVALTACQGRNMSFPDSQAYFNSHEPQLTGIIDRIGRCRPVYGDVGGVHAIRNEEVPAEDPTCASGSKTGVADIRKAILANDILSTDFKLGADGQVSEARFLLYTEGLGVSGGGVWIIFQASGMPAPLDAHQEMRVLDADHHWFWVKT